jgi:lysophospholipid acyltransferase (LPLAT)-like uncharacterized protein
MKAKSFLLWLLFYIVDKTCFWRYSNIDILKRAVESKRPTLICMWHGQFIFPMLYLKKYFPHTTVISSTHKDSMILGNVLKKYKFNLIKGSSTRGANNVLKCMIRAYKNSQTLIAITNDGPKGPARIAKEGSVALAYKMNANILFMTGRSSRFWSLKTWDSFILPKPFSHNCVYIEKISIPERLDKNEIGTFITNTMNKKENDIDKNNI